MRVVTILAATSVTCAAIMPAFAQEFFFYKPLNWPLPMSDPAAQECQRQADAFVGSLNARMRQGYDTGVCEYMRTPIMIATSDLRVFMQYVCQREAILEREAQAQARERALIAGSSMGVAESHTSRRTPDGGALPQSPPPATPNIGGAGGSLAQTQAAEAQHQPPAVPSGGGGGSLAQTEAAQAQPPAAPDAGAARESKLIAGSRASVTDPYTSQRMPNTGGAGSSEPTTWQSQPSYSWSAGAEPSAVPNIGGAGGSLAASPQAQPPAVPDGERMRVASAPATTPAIQQGCDPKSIGDAQLQLLVADPNTRARLTSLMSPQKAKPDQKRKAEPKNRREKRGAPTDADRPTPAGSNSGMSPEAASAIGTMIGVGVGVGLGNVGRSGTSGPAPRGTSGPAPRGGTFDGPPR